MACDTQHKAGMARQKVMAKHRCTYASLDHPVGLGYPIQGTPASDVTPFRQHARMAQQHVMLKLCVSSRGWPLPACL